MSGEKDWMDVEEVSNLWAAFKGWLEQTIDGVNAQTVEEFWMDTVAMGDRPCCFNPAENSRFTHRIKSVKAKELVGSKYDCMHFSYASSAINTLINMQPLFGLALKGAQKQAAIQAGFTISSVKEDKMQHWVCVVLPTQDGSLRDMDADWIKNRLNSEWFELTAIHELAHYVFYRDNPEWINLSS